MTRHLAYYSSVRRTVLKSTVLMCGAVILALGLAGCHGDSTTVVKAAAAPARPDRPVTLTAPKPELNAGFKDQIGSKAK